MQSLRHLQLVENRGGLTTHSLVEMSMAGDRKSHPKEWEHTPAAPGRQDFWSWTDLEMGSGHTPAGFTIAHSGKTMATGTVPLELYVFSHEGPLISGGQTMWQWRHNMSPDEKEQAAPLSLDEATAIIDSFRLGIHLVYPPFEGLLREGMSEDLLPAPPAIAGCLDEVPGLPEMAVASRHPAMRRWAAAAAPLSPPLCDVIYLQDYQRKDTGNTI